MPDFSTNLEIPDKTELIVTPVLEYSTFWSQYIEDKTVQSYFYYFLSFLFFTQLFLEVLKHQSIMIVTNPMIFPVKLPSSRILHPEQIIAFSPDTLYSSLGNNSVANRILRFPYIVIITLRTFYKKQKISLIILVPDEQPFEPENYTIETSEDTLRPTVVLK